MLCILSRSPNGGDTLFPSASAARFYPRTLFHFIRFSRVHHFSSRLFFSLCASLVRNAARVWLFRRTSEKKKAIELGEHEEEKASKEHKTIFRTRSSLCFCFSSLVRQRIAQSQHKRRTAVKQRTVNRNRVEIMPTLNQPTTFASFFVFCHYGTRWIIAGSRERGQKSLLHTEHRCLFASAVADAIVSLGRQHEQVINKCAASSVSTENVYKLSFGAHTAPNIIIWTRKRVR